MATDKPSTAAETPKDLAFYAAVKRVGEAFNWSIEVFMAYMKNERGSIPAPSGAGEYTETAAVKQKS